MIYAGIDAGSRAIKVVLLDDHPLRIVGATACDQGIQQAGLAKDLLAKALEEAHCTRAELGGIIATGYGREALDFAQTTVTEITCHARGVFHWRPEAQTVIDMGGQDSKIIRLQPDGRVRDFSMNDRCAAGTGRFLEMIAGRLGVSLDEAGRLATSADQPTVISSMCAVFAETEIIGLLAAGRAPADIAAGIHTAIATRMAGLAGRRLTPPVIFTGGVARLPAMVRALEQTLQCPLHVCPQPEFTGALGAALLACASNASA